MTKNLLSVRYARRRQYGGAMRMFLLLMVAGLCSIRSFGQLQTFNSNGTFTVPAGVTQITVEAWGGGAAGNETIGSDGGGGGGAYAKRTFTVTPGQNYNVVVGAGGSESVQNNNGGRNGANSTIALSTTPGTLLVRAAGGKSYFNTNFNGNVNTGGQGGAAADCIGDVTYSGGNGGNGNNNDDRGGGGGGSAFTTAVGGNGGNASNNNNGTAGVGYANGGSGSGSGADGGEGQAPGGGGGGDSDNSNSEPGNGAAGRVVVTWQVTPATTVSTTTLATAFSTTYGTASSFQSFTVSGSNLTANLVVTAPAGFEVSTSSAGSYSTSVSLTPGSGTVSSTTIYVRLATTATAVASPYGSNIDVTSTGATARTIGVSGTVAQKGLTVTGLTATSRQYDGTTTVAVTGTPALQGLVNGDVVTLSTSTYTFSTKDAGTNKPVNTNFTLNGTPAGNYTLTQPSLSASVTAIPLTIKADDRTKCFLDNINGTAATTGWTVTPSALPGGESIASVNLSCAGFPASTAAGTYVITPGGATAGAGTNLNNYTISYSNGTLTNQNQVYGTISGAANVQTCTGLNGSVNITLYGTPGFSGVLNITNTATNQVDTVHFTATTTGNVAVNVPASKLLNAGISTVIYNVTWNTLNDATACPATIPSLTGAVDIYVNPVPSIAAVAAQSSICTGSPVSVTVSNPNAVGGTYNVAAIYNGVTGGTIAPSGITGRAYTTTVDETLSLANGVTTPADVLYIFTPVSGNTYSCVGENDTVTIRVNPNPAYDIAVNGNPIANGGTDTVCQAASTTFAVINAHDGDSVLVKHTYQGGSNDHYAAGIISGGTLSATFISGGNSVNPSANPGNEPTEGTYEVIVKNNTTGCATTRTFHIYVQPKPEFNVAVNGDVLAIGGTDTICQAAATTFAITNAHAGDSVYVKHTYQGGSNDHYVAGVIGSGGTLSSSFISGGNSVNPAQNPSNEPTEGTYEVTLKNNATGCTTTRSFNIYVQPKPEFSFEVNGNAVAIDGTDTICQAASTTFAITNAHAGDSVLVKHTYVGGVNNHYATGVISGNGTMSNTFISGGNSVNPSANPNNEPTEGAYEITLKNNTTGCTTTRTFHVYVNPKPEFSFSVNNEVLPVNGVDTICQATQTVFALRNATPGHSFSVKHTWTDGNSVTQQNANYASGVIGSNGGFSNTFVSGGNSVHPAVNPGNEPTAGSYEITLTSPEGCTTTRTFHVYVNPKPTLEAVNTQAVCENAPATVSLTGMVASTSGTLVYTLPSGLGTHTVSWTSNASGEASFTTGNLPYAANGGTISVDGITISGTGCYLAFANKQTTLIVNPKPTLDAAATAAVCENTGATINLSGLLPNTALSVKYNYTHTSLASGTQTATGTSNASGNFSFTTVALPYAANESKVVITELTATATGCSQSFLKEATLLINQQPEFAQATGDTVKHNTDAALCTAVVDYAASIPAMVNGGNLPVTYTYQLTGATTGSGSGNGSGSVFNKGLTHVNVHAVNDCGNDDYSFNVLIRDLQAPLLSVQQDTLVLNVGSGVNCTVSMPDYLENVQAADNCSGTIVKEQLAPNGIGSGVIGYGGVRTVKIKATDVDGNVSVDSFILKLVDATKPQVMAKTQVTLYLDGSGHASLNASSLDNGSFDNCSAVSLLAGKTDFNCSNVGNNTVKLYVTDASANVDSAAVTVNIVDTVRPVITQGVSNKTLAKGPLCTNELADYTTLLQTELLASDAQCGGALTVTQTPLAGTIIAANTPSVPVTLKVADVNGNFVTTTFTVTFTDQTAPAFTSAPANMSRNNDAGVCGAVVTWSAPLAGDNCTALGPVTIAQTAGAASGTVFPVGNSTITYRATDAAGNYKDTSFIITVIDAEAPVIAGVPATVNVNTGAGATGCEAAATWTAPTATDNCTSGAGIVWTRSHQPGDVFPVGTTTVTYIAADAKGNADTVSFLVVVADNTLPVISGLSDMNENTNTAGCRAIVNTPDPAVSDNCGMSGLTWTISGATTGSGSNNLGIHTFEVGTSTVQYTATDIHGNVFEESFTVTVTNNLIGNIGGTSTVTQNSASTSNVVFFAQGGAAPYTFTYKVNGGGNQVISTTGSNTVVTVPQSNAVLGLYTYALVSVTDANGCTAAINPVNDTAKITVVPPVADLTPSLNFTFTSFSPVDTVRPFSMTFRNVGNVPSTGNLVAILTIPVDGSFSYSLAPGTNGWSLVPGIGSYILSSTSPVTVGANGGTVNVSLNIKMTNATAAGSYPVSGTIIPISGENTGNNAASIFINVSQ